MPKKPKPTESPDKLRPDVAETAFRVFQEAVSDAPKTLPPAARQEKNPEAVERGRKGGQRGGKARAANLTPEQREVAAQLAAEARWEKSRA
jgi:hypothetical protein